MRKTLKEFAFSKNAMFDGNGYMRELNFYALEIEEWENSED